MYCDCDSPEVEPKFNYCGLRSDNFCSSFLFSSEIWFSKFGSISGFSLCNLMTYLNQFFLLSTFFFW